MISNSIVVFIRDGLPVFVLIALLLAVVQTQQGRWQPLFIGILVGLLLTAVLATSSPVLSQWCQGRGLEVVLFTIVVLYSVLMLVLVCAYIKDHPVAFYGSVIMVLSLLLPAELHDFGVYFSSLAHESILSLTVGVVMGAAVSLAVAALVHLVMQLLLMSRATLALMLIGLFVAGRLTHSLVWLEQVDLIQQTEPLWRLSAGRGEGGEFAELFKALVGYQSSPTLVEVGLYSLVVSGFALTSHFLCNKSEQQT